MSLHLPPLACTPAGAFFLLKFFHHPADNIYIRAFSHLLCLLLCPPVIAVSLGGFFPKVYSPISDELAMQKNESQDNNLIPPDSILLLSIYVVVLIFLTLTMI